MRLFLDHDVYAITAQFLKDLLHGYADKPVPRTDRFDAVKF